MDALLAAGGVPGPEDPLYEYTQGRPKALLEVAGKPLIQWVLDALEEANTVDQVVVIGLKADVGLRFDKPIAYFPSAGGLFQNLQAGARKIIELNPEANHVLSVASDIPAITGEMVDWLVNAVVEADVDMYYTVIPREVMESRYPRSGRSFLRLKDYELCGGDLNVFRAPVAASESGIIDRIIAARKSPLKQASLIGFDTLLLLLLRRLTLQGGIKRVENRVGLRGRAIISPYAEIGMDVDKPYQLEILRADLMRNA